MAKKNAMFYAAGGRGDHTGFMAVNSTLCTDTVADFDTFYDYFDEIRAYLGAIEPPKFPVEPDPARVAQDPQARRLERLRYRRRRLALRSLDHGQAGVTDEKKKRRIVDTTLVGFSNAGHTYGDRLTPVERQSVIEYMKTL